MELLRMLRGFFRATKTQHKDSIYLAYTRTNSEKKFNRSLNVSGCKTARLSAVICYLRAIPESADFPVRILMKNGNGFWGSRFEPSGGRSWSPRERRLCHLYQSP